jgi:hypothetical protein
MKDLLHNSQFTALEKGVYSKLSIRRYNDYCNLLITIDNETHVYVNRQGKAAGYRHAWQIKKWLNEKFGIEENEVNF